MEWIEKKQYLLEQIKKYRYVVLALWAGLFLMLLPRQEEQPTQNVPEQIVQESGIQESLADILALIAGVGRVEVLLTQAEGEKTYYQTDEEISGARSRKEAVLVTTSSKEETGLIRQVDPPKYQGAVVVCQGADNASVRLSIVEAVKSVTGLTSDHITVLKMK